MRSLAFVDYDNVRYTQDRSAKDVYSNIEELFDQLSGLISINQSKVNDLDVRLYSGWIDELGQYSKIAQWALSAISDLRGRRNGIRLKPFLVTSAACLPTDILIGTLRLHSRRKRQKMVDGLITIDVIHLANEPVSALYLVSDDDDFVPCSLALRQRTKTPCFLLRNRAAGLGLNDQLLSRNGISIQLFRR